MWAFVDNDFFAVTGFGVTAVYYIFCYCIRSSTSHSYSDIASYYRS